VRQIPDPRAERGRRYAWTTLLTLICAALLSGMTTGAAIGQWVHEHAHEWQPWLPTAWGRVPSAATLRRALQRVDVVALEACLQAYTEQALAAPSAPQGRSATGLRALAVDGKAVRGAQRHGAKVHLVSIVTHAQTQVIGQVAVAAKSNEIPAVRALLQDRDLHGCLVTLDAMHTQHATARMIVAQGGHYLLVVKANQPDLYTALAAWFAEAAWTDEQEAQVTTCDVGHGRHEHRTLIRRLVETRLFDLMGWPSVQQALRRVTWAQLRSSGEERSEVTYALTSLPARVLPPALEAAWRGHWTIENRLHYVRDVTWGEDAGQAHCGSTPQALAALRNGLLSLLRRCGYTQIASARRHLGASVPRTLRFLGCSRHIT